MGSWRKTAETMRQGEAARHNRHDRHDSPSNAPNVPIVPNVPADPARTLKRWRAELESLDWSAPRFGLHLHRWQRVLEDSGWLLDRFGEQAARDGWSECDLFGVLPGKDAWGGVADRLRAARSLKMTTERACWRDLITGEPDGFVRGQGDKLMLVVMWER
jgi:hypothetical protein